jgi:hypothetical protein
MIMFNKLGKIRRYGIRQALTLYVYVMYCIARVFNPRMSSYVCKPLLF